MLRGRGAWAAAIGLPAILTAAACSGDIVTDDNEQLTPVVATNLDEIFEMVGAESGVPADLLEAIGYVETRWQMVQGEQEHDGKSAQLGLMAIRVDDLARVAAMAGVDEQDIGEDPASNVRAAAALLNEAATEVGLDAAARADLGAWAPAVALYSGIEDLEGRSSYVFGDVYRVLQEGATETAESGEIVASLPAHPDVVPDYEFVGTQYAAGTDFAGAVWRPSPNYSARPAGNIGKVAMVIIHTCEGGYSGCVSWLRNTAAGASAHYVVKENGAETAQLVRESQKAWHIAATYKSSLNAGVDSWRNGYSSNNFTVGIEHGGFGSQASWSNGLIETSAKLTCSITQRHGIPRDRQHIVGHGQLQPYNRTDPGPNWPWSHYIDRVKAHCGGGGGGGGGTTPPPASTIIVDSNNANNDASKAKITLTGTWSSANSTAGYYGSGYYWGATEETSAPATFSFYLPAAGTRTIDAWWTAGSNRASGATFVAKNAAGSEVGRSTQDQRSNGGAWRALGTWNFSAGWNTVVLSRWAAPGSVVVADAIRVR